MVGSREWGSVFAIIFISAFMAVGGLGMKGLRKVSSAGVVIRETSGSRSEAFFRPR